jgi:hypothetical protein
VLERDLKEATVSEERAVRRDRALRERQSREETRVKTVSATADELQTKVETLKEQADRAKVPPRPEPHGPHPPTSIPQPQIPIPSPKTTSQTLSPRP